MSIDTQFLRHHTDVLEYALGELNLTGPDEVSHEPIEHAEKDFRWLSC